jgi:hypothetical protein
MRISELLTLMGNLSVGNDNITSTERAIFMQYLNLAHLELYQETANFNRDLIRAEPSMENLAHEEQARLAATNTVKLSRMPYLIISVYNLLTRQKLPRLSLEEVIEIDPGLSGKGTPTAYFVQKDTIRFVPAQGVAMPVIVWYVPQPQTLTETTEEGDVPYPVAYHPILVDGALYYLFQEEGGFKNTHRELEARERWKTGKSRLLSYLHSSSGQSFSTFSSL